VGISAYPPESGFPPLHFAAKDAEDLATELQKQGYEIHTLTDEHAMKSSIRSALSQAQDELSPNGTGGNAGTLLFAFSGHGGEKGTGPSLGQFLVTYDASLADSEPGYSLQDVTSALNGSGAARKIMLIDACRDLTPVLSKGAPPLASFSTLMPAEGIKILFSTAPGQQSYEDVQDQNGYFTHYVLQGIDGQAATPEGLVTFDSLANWVTVTMKAAPDVYQVPYWSQNAEGDFYLAGGLIKKQALVVAIDQYKGNPLHSAIAGAQLVAKQLSLDGFDTKVVQDATAAQMKADVADFGKTLGPQGVALFYFSGEGGIAAGQTFLMASDATLPDNAKGGKWESPPANGVTLASVMDTVTQNHPGPNLYFLDMGLARASSDDSIDLAALRHDHSLVLFSSQSGQDPPRTADGSLFSRTVASVLSERNVSASAAATKIVSDIFSQTNGEDLALELPMLQDRVYLTPSN
jgi:uncharacterized caspase-like protein